MSVTNLESLKVDDLLTTYDVAGGAKTFKVPVRHGITYSLQIIWANLSANNASIQLQGSNNNINFDDLPAPSSKNLNSADGSHSFQDMQFDQANFAVDFDPGTVVSGTILLLFKPRI